LPSEFLILHLEQEDGGGALAIEARGQGTETSEWRVEIDNLKHMKRLSGNTRRRSMSLKIRSYYNYLW
jgi:hypothetical protein